MISPRSIAIGPVAKVPSWEWVGADTAKELSKYYDVEQFHSLDKPPQANVILIIKRLPQTSFVKTAKLQGSKIIYCPIDYFEAPEDITGSAVTLRMFDMIVVHCERLKKYLQPFATTHMIDHHGKYTLQTMSSYKEKGYVLWVGGFQFMPYLLKWLNKNPINHELKFLTNHKSESAWNRALLIANQIGVNFNLDGLDLYDWSESLQEIMMYDAKAALDIKGTDFQQITKPPTKAQKYISSGLPLAMNQDSYSSEYFLLKEFHIATPDQKDRWFSRTYYDETVEYGNKLREFLSIKRIGEQYKQYIDMCFNRR